MSARVPDSPTEQHITVAADTAQLAPLRSQVADLARTAGASDDVVEQFELVVSELATNVIQHSDSAQLTVVFHGNDQRWVLDVSNAPTAVELDTPHLPDPDELSGRGLFIVHAVMDSVELIDIDGNQHIRCTKLAS